jgi:hypothetical protein
VAGVRPLCTGRGNEGGLRAAVRGIGVKRTSAQEAIRVASLSNEASALIALTPHMCRGKFGSAEII